MFTHILIVTLAAEFLSIDGRIRDAYTHNAISLASVELRREETPVDRQYSDTEGRFRFIDVVPGLYKISVEISGYEDSLVEVDLPQRAFSVSIDLVPKKTLATLDSSPVVSLHDYLVPGQARKEFELARKQAVRQECSKAVVHFEKGLRSFEEDASAHNDLGNCYRKLGRLDHAEREFKRAHALSDSVYVVLNLAEVFTAQNRSNEAQTLLEETLQKQPNEGDVYYGLALFYFDQGRLEEAESAALQADARNHKIADVHVLLAQIYSRKQESGAAIQQLQRYLEEAPNGSRSQAVRRILKASM